MFLQGYYSRLFVTCKICNKEVRYNEIAEQYRIVKKEKVPKICDSCFKEKTNQEVMITLEQYNFSRILDKQDGMIDMLVKGEKQRKYTSKISIEVAKYYVDENIAIIRNTHTIERIYSVKKFRQFIFERDNNTCFYCTKKGTTIDHIHPRSKGGRSTLLNCVCCCEECNVTKWSTNVYDFINKHFSEVVRMQLEAKLIWIDVMKRLRSSGIVNILQYELWFSDTKATFEEDTLVIHTTNKLSQQKLYYHYSEAILKTVEEVTGRNDIKLGFSCDYELDKSITEKIRMVN